jgi:hypothetical protein
MNGAYFTDRDKLNQNAGKALVSELKPVVVNLLKFQASFPIDHFSGYLISWQ